MGSHHPFAYGLVEINQYTSHLKTVVVILIFWIYKEQLSFPSSAFLIILLCKVFQYTMENWTNFCLHQIGYETP